MRHYYDAEMSLARQETAKAAIWLSIDAIQAAISHTEANVQACTTARAAHRLAGDTITVEYLEARIPQLESVLASLRDVVPLLEETVKEPSRAA